MSACAHFQNSRVAERVVGSLTAIAALAGLYGDDFSDTKSAIVE